MPTSPYSILRPMLPPALGVLRLLAQPPSPFPTLLRPLFLPFNLTPVTYEPSVVTLSVNRQLPKTSPTNTFLLAESTADATASRGPPGFPSHDTTPVQLSVPAADQTLAPAVHRSPCSTAASATRQGQALDSVAATTDSCRGSPISLGGEGDAFCSTFCWE